MRERVLLTVLAAVALVACTSAAPQSSADSARTNIAPWTGELPISAPWLREQLPTQALAYQRIPHPLALMAIPKGNALDAALGSEANIENLMRIQQGLIDNLGVELPPARLLEHLRSPIESVVMVAPAPAAMIATTLSLRSNAEFEAFVAELAEHLPIALARPLDDAGFGQITGAPLPIHVHFDAATGRVALFGGFLVDQSAFSALLATPATAAGHPMHALEQQIDQSGQGFFIWIDAARALQAGAPFLPPEVGTGLAQSGADQIRALAAGAGVANGKGRLKLVADLGTDNTNRKLPVVRNEITATSVGDPRSLLLVSIPGAAEFSRLETLLLASAPAEAAEHWAEVEAVFAEASGSSIEELLSAVGPEAVTVSDRAGDYFGLHVRDHALLDSILERWSAARGAQIAERRVGGQSIRYVDLPRALPMLQDATDSEPNALTGLLRQMRNRVYWIVEGDYLYLASTPQILIDRIGIGADTSIGAWLTQTQRVDVSSSLLAATGSAGNLPRMMYNAYISGMQAFADLVDADYDVWAMPTANQLGLPDRGTLGATVNLGEPYVSLELSYESSPAEILFGGPGIVGAAVGGIAAATILPRLRNRIPPVQATNAVRPTRADDAAVVQPALRLQSAANQRGESSPR